MSDEPAKLAELAPLQNVMLGDAFARGGMGIVHQARDAGLGRTVAVKVLHPRLQGNKAVVERFVEEARLAAMLEHPNIPPIYGLGRRDEIGPFFAMKLIEGQTLLDKLRTTDRPIPVKALDEFVDIMIKVCDALAMAHSVGIVHGDIKTPNIMLGEFGAVYLMDWGNARRFHSPAPRDDFGRPQALGTPSVMAPEQAGCRPVDGRTDVFGVGAVIYTFLAGRAPYSRGGVEARIDAAREVRFKPLSNVARKAPVTLRVISSRAMALNPDDRFQTIGELRAALDAFRRARVPAPWMKLRAGEVLMAQGGPGDYVYVVREGTFRVAIDGVDLSHTPGPGAVLGEIAMITDKPRTATVTAVTDAEVLRIGPELLREELERVSPWVKTLVESLAHRLHRHSTQGG